MTNYFSSYSFMDLLKDHNYVPTNVVEEISIVDEIESSLNNIVDFFDANTVDYDFMDLLSDKGYVPANNGAFYASNDNDIILTKVA